MQVLIHGPGLTDSSAGSYRVHAVDASENRWEEKSNGSKNPETIEVESRADVVDHVYPPETYDRQPGDLALYLADVFFGSSLDELPNEAETTPEGGNEVSDELLKQALELKNQGLSMRKIGAEMNISPTTAKKYVEQAQARAEAAAAEAKANGGGRTGPRANSVAYPDPDKMRTCTYHDHHGDNPLPATTDFFAVRKGGKRAGSFVGWCRDCRRKYAAEAGKARREKAKETAAATASTNGSAPESTETPAEAVTA